MKEVRTNDEIIAAFFEFLVGVPEPEYIIVCRRMKNEGPVPELMEKMICETEKRRNQNVEAQTGMR